AAAPHNFAASGFELQGTPFPPSLRFRLRARRSGVAATPACARGEHTRGASARQRSRVWVARRRAEHGGGRACHAETVSRACLAGTGSGTPRNLRLALNT